MFKRNQDMIFEQEFAQPHSTNADQEFMEENFPVHTPTLWRYEGKDNLFFGPKWNDFWPIERYWENELGTKSIEILGLLISTA